MVVFYFLELSVRVGEAQGWQSTQPCDPTKSYPKPYSKPGKGTDFRPSGMNPLYQKAGGRSWETHRSPQTLSVAWPAMGGLCGLASLAQEGAG